MHSSIRIFGVGDTNCTCHFVTVVIISISVCFTNVVVGQPTNIAGSSATRSAVVCCFISDRKPSDSLNITSHCALAKVIRCGKCATRVIDVGVVVESLDEQPIHSRKHVEHTCNVSGSISTPGSCPKMAWQVVFFASRIADPSLTAAMVT